MKFIVECPKCNFKFQLDDEPLYIGGETPSEETIFLECPNCDYEEGH